jgi:hypothetical protein
MMSVAFGITAPEGSATVPDRLPVVVACPNEAQVADMRIKRSSQQRMNGFGIRGDIKPPCKLWAMLSISVRMR